MASLANAFGQTDPKEQMKEWKKKMRGELRGVDRQITKIGREEQKVKASIKAAAKRGDNSTCKLLAKEIVRSRKAVNRLHTSKAQMNSVMMQMDQQIAQQKMVGHMSKSTDLMKAMSKLAKARAPPPSLAPRRCLLLVVLLASALLLPPSLLARPASLPTSQVSEVQSTMQEMQKEMTKAGIIEEMVDDAMDVLDDEDDDEAADDEVQKVFAELNVAAMGGAADASSSAIPSGAAAAAKEEDADEDMSAMRARLEQLQS